MNRVCRFSSATALLCAASTSFAGTFSSDFNSGTTPAGTTVNGTTVVEATGGVNDSGVLKLTKAINSQSGNNPGAPVAGANSFTEGQAKSRIESKGFSNVSGLKKDDKGVWRGTAMRDGKSVDVSLDFEGNVVAR